MFKNKKIIMFIEILLSFFLIFYLLKFYNYHKDLKKNEILNKNIEIIIKENKEKFTPENYPISNLQETYEDMVGYIEIDGTNITYPIVQSYDNDFYMNHSVDKTFNQNGSIFLDYRNSHDFSDENNILYGHYIKSGKFFYELNKFKTQDFYDNYNSIDIILNNNKKKYFIYSVYIADPNDDYRMIDFENLNEKKQFLKTIKEQSIIQTYNLDMEIDSIKILTLSTCSNKGWKRLVVHAIES